jgi:hypothetical protein
VCNYFAFLYRYDWCLLPENTDENVKTEKVLKDFAKTLTFLDNSNLRKLCGEIALSVIKDGAYCAYVTSSNEQLILQ